MTVGWKGLVAGLTKKEKTRATDTPISTISLSGIKIHFYRLVKVGNDENAREYSTLIKIQNYWFLTIG